MPSRKKARGRKNRAKKEATRTTADLRLLWEPIILRNNRESNNNTCKHMLTLPPRIPQEGPAVSLLNSLSAEGFFNNEASFTVDLLSLVGYSEVVAKESERSLAINLLLRFVRNVLVYDSVVEGEKWFQREHPNDAAICCMIATLEIHGTSNGGAMDYGGATGRRVNKIITKLMGGNRRDVVKFVAKRLPCTCLKKLHSAARKKVTKMGICIACSKQFPRSQLFVCTGCRYVHYCSKECQRADWLAHKRHCHSPEVSSAGPRLQK